MKKGFTLIELIVVIGILAILSTVVILVINPARLFQEARDAQRISDLGSINSALALYLTQIATPDMDGSSGGACGTNCWMGHRGTAPGSCFARYTAATTMIASSSGVIDGTGWIPTSLGALPSGSPLPNYPTDPLSSGFNYYSFSCDNTAYTWELNTDLESARYRSGGTSDAETGDGGNSTTLYEVGSDSGLNL